MSSSQDDPLGLSGLEPGLIQAKSDAAKQKIKVSTELELMKEGRLAEKEKRLATGPKKPPSAPPPPPPPPEVDKSLLLDKIAAYRERFPHLRKRNSVTAKSSADELLDELHYCELQLGSAGKSFNLGASAMSAAATGIERMNRDYWNPLGLNLDGLGTVVQGNMAQFQPIIDELMIKHQIGAYTSPEMRLVLTLAGTIMTVHAANSNPEVAEAVKRMNQGVKDMGARDL
tara:strand:+ start:5465 stop:6151 length:687 start_codon:yes stop_codon:yes gene_type:complete